MKILIVWTRQFNYADGLKYAFESNGHCAQVFELEYFNSSVTGIKKFLYRKCKMKWLADRYNNDMKRRIIDRCKLIEADAVLILNGDEMKIFDEGFFAGLRQINVRTILWLVDGMANYKNFTTASFKNYEYIYTFDRNDVALIKNDYGVVAKYLPLVAAEEVYNAAGTYQKEFDLCFVGGADKKRLSVLESVAEYCYRNNLKMIVYGNLWKNESWIQDWKYRVITKKRYPYLYRIAHNRKILPQELAELYKKTKINLNITTTRHSGLNPRTFEILATKSFQIAEYNLNSEGIFVSGVDFVTYKTTDELLALIGGYIKHEPERDQIAANGYDKICRQYLLRHVVRKIIDDLRGGRL